MKRRAARVELPIVRLCQVVTRFWEPVPDVVGRLHAIYADGSIVVHTSDRSTRMIPRANYGTLLREE